jgi:hypothetical protein
MDDARLAALGHRAATVALINVLVVFGDLAPAQLDAVEAAITFGTIQSVDAKRTDEGVIVPPEPHIR